VLQIGHLVVVSHFLEFIGGSAGVDSA
jgi:hypothetical protein